MPLVAEEQELVSCQLQLQYYKAAHLQGAQAGVQGPQEEGKGGGVHADQVAHMVVAQLVHQSKECSCHLHRVDAVAGT